MNRVLAKCCRPHAWNPRRLPCKACSQSSIRYELRDSTREGATLDIEAQAKGSIGPARGRVMPDTTAGCAQFLLIRAET